MFFIERLSNKIASKISKALSLDKDREEILAYGAFSIIQTLWCIALTVIFGAVFGVLMEALIISFSISLLRKYSGGTHATSPNRCAVIGTIVSVGLALIVNKLINNTSPVFIITYIFISFSISCYIIYRYAPVDTPNKPIVKAETRKRLKNSSMALLIIFTIGTILLYIYYINSQNISLLAVIVSIHTGLLWQTFTLTSTGHFIVSKFDNLLNPNKYTGGEKE